MMWVIAIFVAFGLGIVLGALSVSLQDFVDSGKAHKAGMIEAAAYLDPPDLEPIRDVADEIPEFIRRRVKTL